MLTGVKDIDMIILNKLDDQDLVRVCKVNKLADRLCKDQTFWLNRILHKYPYLSMDILNKYKNNRSWSEYYINDLRKINKDNAVGYLIGESRLGRLDHVILSINNGANIPDQVIGLASMNGHTDTVKYLVEVGADIHGWDDLAIRLASMYGHIDVVKYLVSVGANIHAGNDYAINWARQNGHIEVVDYLTSLP